MESFKLDFSSVPSLPTIPLRIKFFLITNKNLIIKTILLFFALYLISFIVNLFGYCLTLGSSSADCSNLSLWIIPAISAAIYLIVGSFSSLGLFSLPDQDLMKLIKGNGDKKSNKL